MEIFDGVKKFKREIQSLKQLSQPVNPLSEEELAGIKQRVFFAINQKQTEVAPNSEESYKNKFTEIWRQTISVLLGLSLMAGTAFASENSKPGDVLYPVKRAAEKIRLDLAFSEQSKASLKTQFAFERIRELEKMKIHQSQEFKNNNGKAVPNATATGQIRTNTNIVLPLTASSTNNNNKNPNSGRKQTQLEIKAEAEAGLEVHDAINALQKVKTKLEAKGNNQAATAVGNNILKLQNQAVKIRQQDSNNGLPDNEQDRKNPNIKSSTTPGIELNSDVDRNKLKTPEPTTSSTNPIHNSPRINNPINNILK